MLRARAACQDQGIPARPAIFVYTRQDEPSFEERLRGKPDAVKSQELDQKRLVHQFMEENFRDAETGHNIRAYYSFDQPTTFANQLRVQLTQFLDPLADNLSGSTVWNLVDQGPPFRGLEVFEFQYAPIFFGREDEIVTVHALLRNQARDGCAFVLISGASGSGKSSLARAGMLPAICQHELDEVIHHWRRLAIKPSELGPGLLAGLVRALQSDDVLPELKAWADDIDPPADSAADAASFRTWTIEFSLRVRDALKNAKGK